MSAPYTPTGPYSAISHSILSQDILAASTILVSSNSANPIGAFPHPKSNAIEALFISDAGTLSHATRSSTGETGWAVTPLNVQAAEAAAGTAYAKSTQPTTYGFYHDNTSLYYLTFDGTNWSAQGTLLGPAINNMKITYVEDGTLVVYGTSGDTLYAHSANPNRTFTHTTWNISPSADVRLIAYAPDNVPSLQAAWISGGQLMMAQGTIGSSEPAVGPTPATGNTNGATQVVHGFWSNTKNSASFLYFAGGDLWNYCGGPQQVQSGGPSIVTATGYQQVEDDGSQTLHVYAVDETNTLYVLHQNPIDQWLQSGAPNFTQFIPLDAGVSNVVADLNPADGPTLFAIDQGEIPNRANGLRLHAQDPNSGHWWCDNMFIPVTSPPPFEVTRYRTEFTVIDANGIPAQNTPVQLQVASCQSSVNIAIGQTTYGIGPNLPVNVTTDARGKVTFSVLASSGLATPQILLSSGTDISNAQVEASLALHNYLAGNGTLNPMNPGGGLQPFDSAGSTLGAAQFQQQSIITQPNNVGPVATSLQQLGQLGLQQSTAPPWTQCTNGDSSDTARNRARAVPMSAMSFGSWFDSIAGDVVHAVEKGVLTIAHDVVNGVDKGIQVVTNELGTFIQLTINELGTAVNLAVHAVEDVAHAIGAAVMWVVAKVEDFINWLKALFNFAAIMQTAKAFASAITSLPDYITNTLVPEASKYANGWFQGQKSAIKSAFGGYQPSSSNISGVSPQYSSPAGGPSSSSVSGVSVAPSDCVHNVHGNFMQDKVMGSTAGSSAPYSGTSDDPWSTFQTAIQSSLQEFVTAFNTFADLVKTMFSDADAIGSFPFSAFLSAFAENVIDALIDLADAAVQGLLGMASDVMTAMMSILTTQIDIGFLQTIWSWVAGDWPLNLVNLVSLVVAFPVTILYALMNDGSEPFPASPSSKRAMPMDASSNGNPAIAALLQLFYWLPAVISLQGSPWPLTVVKGIMTGLIFYFNDGLKDPATVGIWSGLDNIAPGIIWILPAAYFLIQCTPITSNISTPDKIQTAITAYGALLLVFTAIAGANNTISDTTLAANVLLSLPRMFAFLQTSYFTGNEAVTAFNALIVTVGYIGGGLTELAATAS